jgi:DNA/RNA endonuclease YhcR with UshA esterase domain
MTHRTTRILSLLLILLAACQNVPNPTAPPPPAPTVRATSAPAAAPTATSAAVQPPPSAPAVLISELLPGVPGDNNLEFIELYNSGPLAVDLDGWSLAYRFRGDEQLLFRWDGRADIPAFGHVLLLRPAVDLGAAPDFTYELPLFERQGVITLRDAGGAVRDTLYWGSWEGEISAAPAPADGASLERLPGGPAGSSTDTGDNAADFRLNPQPDPQNSGSDLVPLPDERLALQLTVPESVPPGQELSLSLQVANLTGGSLGDLTVSLPLPAGFELVSAPAGAVPADGSLSWPVPPLAAGETERYTVALQSPWSVLTASIRGAYAETAGGTLRAYAAPVQLAVAGGPIPIANARTLTGETVTVEGTATMYTDGYYAGTTGTSFYVQDETGGIQVYCPGAKGVIEVSVGDRVRVSGEIQIYRNAVELVPATFPDDVEILTPNAGEVPPVTITVQQGGSDQAVLGRLNAVEGLLTRVDEFSYSYELDLAAGDSGETQLVYIDKETGISVEPLIVGERYRVVGISEMYDTLWELKPRRQADLQQLFPPELMLSMSVPPSALPGATVSYTLTAVNHTPAALTQIEIRTPLPAEPLSLEEVLDGGRVEGDGLVWALPELAAEGGTATVR